MFFYDTDINYDLLIKQRCIMIIPYLTRDTAPTEKLSVPVGPAIINQIIESLNTLTANSNVKTIRKTIGFPGSSTCDYKFTSADNTTEQVITIENCIPARARVVDIYL